MIKHTQQTTKRPHRAFVGLLLTLIMVFSIGFGIFGILGPKTAEASNDYISNISFYKNADGIAIMKFFVNTSFDILIGPEIYPSYGKVSCQIANARIFGKFYYPDPISTFGIVVPNNSDYVFTCNRTFHYVAGNYYTNVILHSSSVYINETTKKICILGNCPLYGNIDLIAKRGEPTSTAYLTEFGYTGYPEYWPFQDSEKYYFSEMPSLTITYPLENAEIADAFYVQGSYTIPAGSDLDTLLVMVNEVGNYGITYYGFFQEDLTTSGSVNVRISGVASGDYELFFAFMEYADDQNIFIPPLSIPITVVKSIPSELPETGETPPDFFGVIRGIPFYPTHSNYTEPTNLYLNLVNTIQPVIITI